MTPRTDEHTDVVTDVVTDQTGGGRHVLYQDVFIPPDARNASSLS